VEPGIIKQSKKECKTGGLLKGGEAAPRGAKGLSLRRRDSPKGKKIDRKKRHHRRGAKIEPLSSPGEKRTLREDHLFLALEAFSGERQS